MYVLKHLLMSLVNLVTRIVIKLKEVSHQGKENWEPDNKQVPGWVEINKLEVGQPDSRDDAKHDAENAANDGLRDGQEKSPQLGEQPYYEHENGPVLHHPSTANLGQRKTM